MPVQNTIQIDGAEVRVVHPKFDLGTLDSVFDGNFKSIARTVDSDPSIIQFHFAAERSIAGVRLTVWSPRYDLRLRVVAADDSVSLADAEVNTGEGFTTFELNLPTPVPNAREVSLTIDKHGDNKVHIQEIEFLP